MEIGPVEYIVIDFPGNQFSGEILPALQELVSTGTIRIIDLVVVSKDAAGNLTIAEMSEASALADLFGGVEYEVQGLFNEEDIALLGATVPDNSTAALMVWENVWAARFAQAVRNANGMVLDNARIPHEVVQAAYDYLSA